MPLGHRERSTPPPGGGGQAPTQGFLLGVLGAWSDCGVGGGLHESVLSPPRGVEGPPPPPTTSSIWKCLSKALSGKKENHFSAINNQSSSRLLRDSHLGLKNETLRENSRLILDLNSQCFWKNSHSHSQLSKIIQLSFSTLGISRKLTSIVKSQDGVVLSMPYSVKVSK